MNIQQIKQILDNAPDWAIEVCQMGVGNNRFKFYDTDGRREEKLIALDGDVYPFTMSINCPRNQLALIEENEKLKAQLEFVANRVNIDEKGNASFPCGGFYDVERTLNNLKELSND